MKNEDEDANQRLMRRVQFVKNHEELGKDLAVVNEGPSYRSMDPYYYGVDYSGDGSVKAQKLSNKEVFTGVHGNSENDYRKFMRQAESSGVEGFDTPTGDVDWMQGVLSELPSEDEFMLEFEYLLGETAVATKKVADKPALREEWVFNYGPEYVVLTGKLEFQDRFSGEPWECVGTFEGVKTTEEKQVRDMEGVEQTVLDEFGYEVVCGEREPDMLDDNPEVLKTAVEGFISRIRSDGESLSASVQVLPENSDVFRVVLGDEEMYYYIFEPVDDIGLEFRIPQFALDIFEVDGCV